MPGPEQRYAIMMVATATLSLLLECQKWACPAGSLGGPGAFSLRLSAAQAEPGIKILTEAGLRQPPSRYPRSYRDAHSSRHNSTRSSSVARLGLPRSGFEPEGLPAFSVLAGRYNCSLREKVAFISTTPNKPRSLALAPGTQCDHDGSVENTVLRLLPGSDS
eukprot:1905352-Rhodomonas_salina.3